AVRKMIFRAAASESHVLVLGPTGSGKELVSLAIHRASGRAHAPFVDVNCGAIPESLFEAELFGHAKGAFTGAECDRAGYFAGAGSGTLFLDELGELPIGLQSKLLRVLETGCYRPIGVIELQSFSGR